MSELRMPLINQVSLTGRLTQEPELRSTEKGVAHLRLRLACNRPYRDRQGEWQEETSFFNIVLWDKLATYGAERLHKGTPVFVSGRLRSFSWKDADETPHSLVEVRARHLQLLEKTQDRAAPGLEEESAEEDTDGATGV